MSNMIYRNINYISWKNEALQIKLQNDEMIEKLKTVKATRERVSMKTKRALFTEFTYNYEQHGDYIELYLLEDGQYKVYRNNLVDSKKNDDDGLKKIDYLFDYKFREFNGISLRKAYGFVDKSLKRCIPRQFYYINNKFRGKLLRASGIDASSQYPSGCLGKLPDMHQAIRVRGKVKPTEEYPFAFYASGHLAIYNELDTHNWMESMMCLYLFRLDQNEDYPYRPLKDDEEETILMKASPYTMDSTFRRI